MSAADVNSSTLGQMFDVSGAERIIGIPDAEVLARAVVPEHSVYFMEAMSGGHSFTVGDYFFLTSGDWLMAIGYPLSGGADYDFASFRAAIDEAVRDAAKNPQKPGAEAGRVNVHAVAPYFPADFDGQVSENDHFFILPSDSPVPERIKRHLRKAEEALRVDEGTEFTPAHRRLWSEILTKTGMRNNVREMYAKTGHVMSGRPRGLSFLNAWDEKGNLAASLLVDSAPGEFLSYIIGAHSRRNYTPYATDLLFAAMLEKAGRENKKYVHLGLGVNEGIERFKRKWGGVRQLSFAMANWTEDLPEFSGARLAMDGVVKSLRSRPPDMSKQQIFDTFPQQRTFAMLWELEKNGRKSWIGGSAHFNYYSYSVYFEKFYENVDTVIFEGPLDAESLDIFEKSGRARKPGDANLYELMTREEYLELKRVVRGPEGRLARLLGMESDYKADVDYLLKETRPWYAFFSMWTGFLTRLGWKESVDLECWNLAKEMGKTVIAMETHEEQLASLESIPVERILSFFRSCAEWPKFAKMNLTAYLHGDLGMLFGTSTEFPTRTNTVIGVRDVRFCERMRPFMEQGRAVAFVGTAHMLQMRGLLRDMGFSVRKVYPTLRHRLRARYLGGRNKKSDFS